MAFNRQLAVDWIKGCINCHKDLIEEPGREVPLREGQRVFVWLAMGLAATALKMAGDPAWETIYKRQKQWIDFKHIVARNVYWPIYIDEVKAMCTYSFQIHNHEFHYSGGSGTNDDPLEVINNVAPADPLTDTPSMMTSNRGLMRALYHHQKGETTTANSFYDYVIANKQPDGAAGGLAEPFELISEPGHGYDGRYQYASYKMMIQWIVAHYMGKTRLKTDFLDTMQDPVTGRLNMFYASNYDIISQKGNTEGTPLAVIADVLWNP